MTSWGQVILWRHFFWNIFFPDKHKKYSLPVKEPRRPMLCRKSPSSGPKSSLAAILRRVSRSLRGVQVFLFSVFFPLSDYVSKKIQGNEIVNIFKQKKRNKVIAFICSMLFPLFSSHKFPGVSEFSGTMCITITFYLSMK